MFELTNEEFISFLNYYNNFLIPISEITKSSKGDSLIKSDLKAYSLKDMIYNVKQSTQQ